MSGEDRAYWPIFLGLGSNVGDRGSNLQQAFARLENAGIQIKRQSSIYLTEPVDFLSQRWFLNQVLEATTVLHPHQLLEVCLEIEHLMGRNKTVEKGPRCIDIDVLLYEDLVTRTPQLTVPHPRLHLRRFILLPLSDLAPELIPPGMNHPVSRLLRDCKDQAQVMQVGHLSS